MHELHIKFETLSKCTANTNLLLQLAGTLSKRRPRASKIQTNKSVLVDFASLEPSQKLIRLSPLTEIGETGKRQLGLLDFKDQENVD